MTDAVLTKIANGILTIRLNRLEKRNSLTRAMYSSIADSLAWAQANDSIRVVVLTGHPTCFTAGNDLSDAAIEGLEGPHGRFMSSLMEFTKPVVAAPCGIVVGVGITMLLHCDLVYCGSQTTFKAPFVSLAVCPEFGSSYLLPQLVGHHRASEILIAGEAFDAAAALELRLVNGVFPNSQVEEVAQAKAELIAAQPPESVRTTKMLLKRSSVAAVRDVVKVEIEHLVRLQLGPEAREALEAFKGKRRPDFSRFA
ncbi:MAG: enoyl-CoA hydratase/isomerase family protein [Xanthobacteraceae bacterium]|nr:enoyl-CoA hydratase/isomerase family protein [Xanthobacteraceae bacterium]